MSDVLIVGAGISGLSVGYNLDILSSGAADLQILEARSRIGGRTRNVKEEASFINFDLDMGGQDLFLDDFEAYRLLLSDGEDFPYTSVSWARDDVDYLNCQPSGNSFNCQEQGLFRNDLRDSSFRDSSLAAFVADNFLPRVENDVRLDTVVTEIDYSSSDKVVARTADGRAFEADQLVVAVPVTQLQKGAIRFVPALPRAYADQIDDTRVFQGSRIWVEFSEKFYEDVTRVDDLVYWDAARGKNTRRNIVTIQGVSETELTRLNDVELLDRVLDDLDAAYDGRATETFTNNFFVKNWREEEFIEMTNVNKGASPDENLDLFRSAVGGRVWFAGDYTRFGDENSAAQSGKYVAGRVYQELTGDEGLCAPFLRPADLVAGDEVCFSAPDQCEATADLSRNGRESCSSWCDRQSLRCTGAWDDGTFCEKTGAIGCGTTGNNNSICRCEPRHGAPAPTPKPTRRPTLFDPPTPTPTLCQGFLSPVDLVSGNGVCVDTQDVCEAEADLNRNGRESCNAWCEREGLVCTGAWDDGAVCEKRGRINCSTEGNRASICRCEPRDTNLCNRFLSPRDRIVGDEICTNTRSRCTATADLSLNNRESCDQWCEREGLRCTRAWDDGDFCEKRGTIPCSERGNNRSICQCEP